MVWKGGVGYLCYKTVEHWLCMNSNPLKPRQKYPHGCLNKKKTKNIHRQASVFDCSPQPVNNIAGNLQRNSYMHFDTLILQLISINPLTTSLSSMNRITTKTLTAIKKIPHTPTHTTPASTYRNNYPTFNQANTTLCNQCREKYFQNVLQWNRDATSWGTSFLFFSVSNY